jgi:hypothetical protein
VLQLGPRSWVSLDQGDFNPRWHQGNRALLHVYDLRRRETEEHRRQNEEIKGIGIGME